MFSQSVKLWPHCHPLNDAQSPLGSYSPHRLFKQMSKLDKVLVGSKLALPSKKTPVTKGSYKVSENIKGTNDGDSGSRKGKIGQRA